mgnify:CR=1 FL=1
MEVVEILKKAIDQNASDIFFVAGSPCMFKVGQQLVKVTQEKMMPNDTKDIVQQLYGFAPYCSYENFEKNGEDDFSFSLSQVGRFRVNAKSRRFKYSRICLKSFRSKKRDYLSEWSCGQW